MKRTTKQKKTEELVSSNFKKDEDIKILKLLVDLIKKKYNLSPTDVLNLAQKQIMIPCTIFNKKLSPLETYAKYLKENLDLSYTKIGKLLGRSRKTIWQAHKNAKEKMSGKLKPKETEFNIPVDLLKSKLSILEATVVYLKEQYDLSYHDIGELLKRDERTIWTVYNRAQKKHLKIKVK